MFANLVIGALAIALTVVIHSWGLIIVSHVANSLSRRLHARGRRRRIIAMVNTVLGIFAVMSVEVWLWAAFHYGLGVVDGDFETALYFSAVSFSTLGFGDVLPAAEWRLFAALEGIAGFVMIGWSTAYLVAAGIRVGPFRTGEHF